MRSECRKTKAKNSHSEYVIFFQDKNGYRNSPYYYTVTLLPVSLTNQPVIYKQKTEFAESVMFIFAFQDIQFPNVNQV
jgi:hypothetical protein